MRTKTVLETIRKNYGKEYDVLFFGTNVAQAWKVLLHVGTLVSASKIVIMPAQRSIKMVVKLVDALGLSKRVVHVAIGGWLPEYTEKDADLLAREKKFSAVLVQMESMREKLHGQGLTNAVWFPNYRSSAQDVSEKNVVGVPRNFVFYSRVIREKGVFAAVEAIKRLMDEGEDVSLDIYGPIEDAVKQELEQQIGEHENIKYRRVLYGEEILQVLSQYDCMLFPTCYTGEGFPGAVLESMMAGVPVIATDWKYNSEIVKDGKTGIICGAQTESNVYDAIKRIRDDLTLYRGICKGAYSEAGKYSEKTVASILIDSLNKIV